MEYTTEGKEKVEFFKNDGGYVRFYFLIDKITDFLAEVSVFEVGSWNCDEEKTYDEGTRFLSVAIKWDGCSHLNFVDDSYLHLCGKWYWEEFGKMMTSLYNEVTSRIKEYDGEL